MKLTCKKVTKYVWGECCCDYPLHVHRETWYVDGSSKNTTPDRWRRSIFEACTLIRGSGETLEVQGDLRQIDTTVARWAKWSVVARTFRCIHIAECILMPSNECKSVSRPFCSCEKLFRCYIIGVHSNVTTLIYVASQSHWNAGHVFLINGPTLFRDKSRYVAESISPGHQMTAQWTLN